MNALPLIEGIGGIILLIFQLTSCRHDYAILNV